MRSARVKAAQEALDAAIREMVAATDESDLADARRLHNDEEASWYEEHSNSVVTHWVVAISRTQWKRDPDDLEDPAEYPHTLVSALIRDDTAPEWMLSGLLRKVASVVDTVS